MGLIVLWSHWRSGDGAGPYTEAMVPQGQDLAVKRRWSCLVYLPFPRVSFQVMAVSFGICGLASRGQKKKKKTTEPSIPSLEVLCVSHAKPFRGCLLSWRQMTVAPHLSASDKLVSLSSLRTATMILIDGSGVACRRRVSSQKGVVESVQVARVVVQTGIICG